MFSSDRCFNINIAYYFLLRTGWSGDRIPVGARFSASVQACPGTHPFSYKLSSVSLSPEVKRPGCGFDQELPSSPEIKKRVQLYLYFPFVPSWPVLRVNLHF
jgi:hypothetical protein